MNNIDINKIVDDAMEKKDREVCIFISDIGTTVKVKPLADSDPRWIILEKDNGYNYACSECHANVEIMSPYCPVCGEKLRFTCDSDCKEEAADEISFWEEFQRMLYDATTAQAEEAIKILQERLNEKTTDEE